MAEWMRRLREGSRNMAGQLGAQLLCWMAALIVLERAGSLAAERILSGMGYSYLTAENFAVFLSNPLTAALLLGGGVFLLGVLELDALMHVQSVLYGRAGMKRGALETVEDGIDRWKELWRRGGAVWLAPAGLFGIAAGGGAAVGAVRNMKLLRYAFQRAWNAGGGPWMGVLALALAVLSLFSVFVFPAALCEKKRAGEAFRESFRMVGGNLPRVAGGLALCWMLVLTGFLLLYYLAMGAAAAAVWLLRPAEAVLPTLYLLDGYVQAAGFLAAGVVGAAVHTRAVMAMYARYRPEAMAGRRRKASRARRRRRAAWIMAFLFVLEAAYLYQAAFHATQIAEDLWGGTYVTAHRGGAAAAPENTLAALESAIDNASDYAEIDVQETKDGVLILLHDSDFSRTTGWRGKVWETDYRQVCALDAGSSFSDDFAGEPVPTLEEALELCQGRLDLNIELKSNGHNEGIVEKTVALIETKGMEGQCVITSMDYQFLREVKELNGDIRTGYIVTMAYGQVGALEYADFLSASRDCVTEGFVRRAHRSGKEVHVWTVNSRRDMRRMIAAGADNLITDRPGVAREVLEEDGSSLGFMELFAALWG